MTGRRLVPLVAALTGLALLVPPAHAGVRFTEPVPLDSFSPARTAVGTVYSITRGQDPSDHEWSGEPVIAVDHKGTVYIAGTCCVVAASPVWYSADGKEFREAESPGHVREWGIGAEGDVEVDDEGRLYFVDTYIPGLLFSRWSDHGKTWDYTVPANGVIPGFDDRPWISWTKKGLYLYVNHVSHTQVYRSDDGGITWTSEGPLSWDGSIGGQPYFPGHMAANRETGAMWVSGMVRNPDGDGDVLGAAVSTDGGKTYREAVVAVPPERGGISPIFTGVTAVDVGGTGYVTWSEYRDEDKTCGVYYAYSSNEGKSWSEPIRVSTGSGCATFPWIAAGDKGKVALAWYETPASPAANAAQLLVRALTVGKTLYGGIEIADIAPQDELPPDAPWYTHLALVPNATSKKPVIVEDRVPTKTPVLAGPLGRELWDFLQVDIGPDGRAHVTYATKYEDSAPQTWYVANKTGPRLR